MPRPVILLIQQRESGEMYAEYLRFHDLTVLVCADAASALEVAASADVIVTGIALAGGMTGLQLIAELRRRAATAATPIIVVTACVTPEYEDRAAEAGGDMFLGKPCLPDQLLRAIRRVLLRDVRGATAKTGITETKGEGATEGGASTARSA